MSKYRKFTPEYREEAVKMVIQTQRPTAEVARELGINEGTLGTWVNKYRNEHPVSEELSLPDRAKLNLDPPVKFVSVAGRNERIPF